MAVRDGRRISRDPHSNATGQVAATHPGRTDAELLPCGQRGPSACRGSASRIRTSWPADEAERWPAFGADRL